MNLIMNVIMRLCQVLLCFGVFVCVVTSHQGLSPYDVDLDRKEVPVSQANELMAPLLQGFQQCIDAGMGCTMPTIYGSPASPSTSVEPTAIVVVSPSTSVEPAAPVVVSPSTSVEPAAPVVVSPSTSVEPAAIVVVSPSTSVEPAAPVVVSPSTSVEPAAPVVASPRKKRKSSMPSFYERRAAKEDQLDIRKARKLARRRNRLEALVKKTGVDRNEMQEHMKRRRWPRKTIRVGFTDDYPETGRAAVHRVMDKMNQLTCVKFVNVTDNAKYHLLLDQKRMACSSVIGYRQQPDGYQTATLHPMCLNEEGKIVHLFMHVLGIHHQQVRSDRDGYVTIHHDKIMHGAAHNFRKMENRFASSTLGLPYDYGSVMHSPVQAFSNRRGPTMSLKKPYTGTVGQRTMPSAGDVAAVNRLYECWDGYLGDDLPGAVPYKDFHKGFMAHKPKISDALQQWIDDMKEHVELTPEPEPAKPVRKPVRDPHKPLDLSSLPTVEEHQRRLKTISREFNQSEDEVKKELQALYQVVMHLGDLIRQLP
ncbi:uncharacterized protein [Panulirus ornatus]|uniref:uncharacterized protein n=1 Tax=Panulirus ornatus TaxID=150431 RepID=UPI003A8C77B0